MQVQSRGGNGGGYSRQVVLDELGSDPRFIMASGFGVNVAKFVGNKPTKDVDGTRYVLGVDGGQPITVKFPPNYAPEDVEQYDTVEVEGLVGIRITRGNKVYFRADSMKKAKK